MKIAIVGTGYVGLVSGACFAEMGIDVVCVDVDKSKIENLKNGIIPIYEPNLDTLVTTNQHAKRLHFTTDLVEVLNDVDIVFLAVGTPPDEDGSADLRHVLDVAKCIGKNLNKYILVVTKSTVPVGTSEKIRQTIAHEISLRKADVKFDVASNPEFLKEGSAIEDFVRPDRVVVGVDSEKAKELMTILYKPILLNNFRVIFMDIKSAEMTKYAANSMLAARISFMNDIANLCELVGADVNAVRMGMGSDSRIGSKFLYAGCGYGGSCFPKDVKALIKTAKDKGYSMRVIEAAEAVNDAQKFILFNKFKKFFNGEIKGRKVAIWGLSFKPGTDDMREAPSLTLIESLLEAGCDVTAYDPVAIEECRRKIGDKIKYAQDPYECAMGAEAIFHVTEWKEFRFPDWELLRKNAGTKKLLLLDGRNVFADVPHEGIDYIKIG